MESLKAGKFARGELRTVSDTSVLNLADYDFLYLVDDGTDYALKYLARGLPKQVRNLDDTPSAYDVMRKHFFPDDVYRRLVRKRKHELARRKRSQ